MDDHIKNFLEYVFQVVEGVERVSQTDVNFKTCAECGTTFGGFKKTGKLGCAACYEAFRAQITQVLSNIHYGAKHHAGKLPHYASTEEHADLILRRELDDARLSLKQAIEAERYEDAARFRDQINALAERIDG